MSERDPDWLLGLAKLRAQQIINLVDMLGSGVPRPVVMEGILAEARAILNDEEPAA